MEIIIRRIAVHPNEVQEQETILGYMVDFIASLEKGKDKAMKMRISMKLTQRKIIKNKLKEPI